MAVTFAPVSHRRGRPPRSDVFRPTCPLGHSGRVILDGHFGQWSPYHQRPRYRCFHFENGVETCHAFALRFGARHPTDLHPTAAGVCLDCEHKLERHEGPRGASDFLFVVREIAGLLIDIGDGRTLRDSALRMRRSAQRTRPDPESEAANKRRAKRIEQDRPVRAPKGRDIFDEEYSKDGRLAATYLDAFRADRHRCLRRDQMAALGCH